MAQIARLSLIVGPGDILLVVISSFRVGHYGLMSGHRTVVCDRVACDCGRIGVSAAGDFIPRIVGQTVAVDIAAHHDDARLAAASVGFE